MIKLGVNIDHVASLRQLRKGSSPDIVLAAALCEKAGADGIVAHLREDRRHIQDADVFLLRKKVTGKLNLEMSINEEIVRIACTLKPDQATLVPERRQELTTEGGLDVLRQQKNIGKVVEKLKAKKICVSLFIEPERRHIKASHMLGAESVELHTGRFANSRSQKERTLEVDKIKQASSYAHALGLHVFAGHGLDYDNIKPMCQIDHIEEFNIGYSIICHSVFVGLEQAVRQMRTLIKKYSR